MTIVIIRARPITTKTPTTLIVKMLVRKKNVVITTTAAWGCFPHHHCVLMSVQLKPKQQFIAIMLSLILLLWH